METERDVYQEIAERTGGNVYIGVVGPVRTGKSTFIKRFMDVAVLPNVTDAYEKERVQDELPQSGSGRTITTTEPKFVPGEAVEVTLPGNLHFRVRLVDCVGYMVKSAVGHLEEGRTRMVSTPWKDEKIPFEEAAEYGTRKVMTDHSTIGLLVTTDGSISDIRRQDYEEPEERIVKELKDQGKPFAVLVNSVEPRGETARELAEELQGKYGVPAMAVNAAKLNESEIGEIMENVLEQFPAAELCFYLPGCLEGLPSGHPLKSNVLASIRSYAEQAETVRDAEAVASMLADGEIIKGAAVREIDLGRGTVVLDLIPKEGLFYQIIGELMEQDIRSDRQFFDLVKDYSSAKKSYDRLALAMAQVEEEGYGIVQPEIADMTLEEPELFKQGNKYGVRLRARAPSLHVIRTDVTTEVAPVVGSEKQGEDLIDYLQSEFQQDPAKIWETNIFGKSLQEMVTEQMENKLTNVPENIRAKMQTALQKVADEGREYMIIFVL